MFNNSYKMKFLLIMKKFPNFQNILPESFIRCSHSVCCTKQTSFTHIPHKKMHSFFKDFFHSKSTFGQYSPITKLCEVSAPLSVPKEIIKPLYYESGIPSNPPESPDIKQDWQIKKMRKSCQLARSVMDALGDYLQVGLKHNDIDMFAHRKITEYGAYPSPLNYKGFPKSICTSVNNVVCHGIPDERQLQDGDILSIDITVYYEGYHGDCCQTFLIGNVDEKGIKLVKSAKKCCDSAIAICGPGIPFKKIGDEVVKVAQMEHVTVVPAIVGHGIGAYFHGPPDIYHCLNDYPGIMQPGMTFTIEPVVSQGKENIVVLEDGWTVLTVDNGRAAQFEHTILITENGHEILTEDN